MNCNDKCLPRITFPVYNRPSNEIIETYLIPEFIGRGMEKNVFPSAILRLQISIESNEENSIFPEHWDFSSNDTRLWIQQ